MYKTQLFIVCGPSGVGKSTTAKALAKKVNGIVLTSEQIIKELYGTTSNENKDKDFTKEEITLGYQAMLIIAKRILLLNKSVILDGVFRSEEQRNSAVEMATNLNIPSKLILVTCPEEIIQERVTQRFKSGSQPGGFQNHLYLKKIFEPIKQKHFIVDSSKELAEQINKIV